MIVVSDTSPLRYLVAIGHVNVLPKLYGEVLCPSEVIWECLHLGAPEELRHWAGAPPEWIKIQNPSGQIASTLSRLDPGESAAISLAHEIGAHVLLIDERKGRQTA